MTWQSDEEKQMISMKYKAKQIAGMSEQEIKNWGKALLMKIHVITGWVIPANEFLFNILKDQFEKKLQEDYGMLNTEEIEYAFRRTGTTTIDWGKEMNLNLVDQVLQPYVSKRLDASAAEEKLTANKPAQKIYTDEEILNERRGEIELAYQGMRKGHVPLMHVYFPEVLMADGFIKEEADIAQFFVDRLNSQVECIYEKD